MGAQSLLLPEPDSGERCIDSFPQQRPEFRRKWRKRVVDHDGERAGDGGIERWLRLAEATGYRPGARRICR